ncbi:uncharacterized protein [Diabrotica undecimpunctata]|uniref:uncharacterized protein n=1 Tax=Diabrotica undecimpunctata TaxID=50387 RepID=UPI003B63616D
MAEGREKELNTSRGTIKGQLTTFETFLNKCRLDNNLLIELESRLDRAVGLLDKFEEVQNEIDNMASDEEFIRNASVERDKFENSFYRVISLAKNMLQESQSHLVDMGGSQVASSSSNHSNHGGLALQAKPRLPAIPIPTYNGNRDMWIEFKETYESLVHNNDAISSIEKFHFLKRALQGDPEKIVKMRKMTAENYDVVWQLLCDRYDDKPLLVGFHIDALLVFRSLSKESATDLRDMLDTIIESLFALEKLNVESNSWDPFLFFKLNIYGRYKQAQKLGLCLNCLQKTNHVSKNCQSGSCRKCGRKHNTLLHYASGGADKDVTGVGYQEDIGQLSAIQVCEEGATASVNNGNQSVAGPSNGMSFSVNSVWLENGAAVPGEVLLSTALVQIIDGNGKACTCRALLDYGSQPNLISEEVVKRLNLPRKSVDLTLAGVGSKVAQVKYRCNGTVESIGVGFKKTVSFLIVPQITGVIPSQNIPTTRLNIPKHLRLADPGFHKPGKIDLLLGVDIFYELLCVGQIRLGPNLPLLQKTKLGCVLDISQQLEKFWQIEEVPDGQEVLSKEDIECEQIFQQTTKRAPDGKFVVHIPLKKSVTALGQSRQSALNRFYKLEQKLQKNEKLQELYIKFMQDYIDMGHMSLSDGSLDTISYYFPHHGVINENSETTRLRVVFNGSATTDTSVSFNDLQYNGPKVQEDLVSILLRFRQHYVVVGGDVAKMYRMIWVVPEQRSLQKVFWRASPDADLKEYTLNTVTYGTKSAPYLAIRCLKELGVQCAENRPEASQTILKDFYVDDLLTGAESAEEAISLCEEVDQVLQCGGMELRKWITNSKEVQLALAKSEDVSGSVQIGEKDKNKTLGLMWAFKEDTLMFAIDFSAKDNRHTKRSILSEVLRIFDPLGLVGPSVLLAKQFLQKMWQQKLHWDESLPYHLETEWRKLRAEFLNLNSLRIKRHVVCKNNCYNSGHSWIYRRFKVGIWSLCLP